MTKFRNGDRVMHRDHDWAVTVIADGPGPNGWIPVVNDDGNFNCLAAGFLSLVPLADPAPVGLTEDEALILDEARNLAPPDPDHPIPWDRYLLSRLLAIIDRLSAAPVDDRERVPEGWRVEWRGAWTFKEPGPPRPVLVPVSPSVDPEDASDD